ncbi:hypothetical protein ACHQM5_002019 [Ranunculus cassubicifolius]
MYCNLGKSQVIPLTFRISSQPKYFESSHCFKFQSFSNGVYLKPFSPNGVHKIKLRHFQSGVYGKYQEDKFGMLSSGFQLHNPIQCVSMIKRRNFSNGDSQKHFRGGEGEGRGRKNLPWIASAYKSKEPRVLNKRSSGKASPSSWEESANKIILKNGTKDEVENIGSRDQLAEMVETHRSVDRSGEEENVDEKMNNDPRWDRIKSRYTRNEARDVVSDEREVRRWSKQEPRDVGYDRPEGQRWSKQENRDFGSDKPEVRRWSNQDNRDYGSDKPEVRRWSKQDNWGKKIWKEASESTSPKMTGEGIYGVGPVLAALSAGRRDFYALYVQEGLDLSSNNRKKKDKKGFERILRMAEKLGLSKHEVSKHDLNMIVENRPHQGLVLDASPLDLVNIRELDSIVVVDRETAPLWVALDEVTDPQNLGAIIRSSYFFGAAGVVVCAKNSAPLSGVVSKASAGSLELMELRSCKNMMQFLTLSAENGWRVMGGSVSSRAIPLNEVQTGAPTVLVLGSEGKGLRPLVERSCTDLIRIPGNIPVDVSVVGDEDEKADVVDHCSGKEFRSFMAVESLNVSVAAGVLLHHLIGNNNISNYGVDDTQASPPLESLPEE